MKLRFFYLDAGTVHKANQAQVVNAWLRKKPWDDSAGTRALHLATIVCDDDFRPLSIHLLGLVVENGWITEEFREAACRAVQNRMTQGHFAEQREAWEGTLDQLAVALDIPYDELGRVPLRACGPLPMSLLAGVSVEHFVWQYQSAFC